MHDLSGEIGVACADSRGKVTVVLETLQVVLLGADEVRADHDRHVDDACQHGAQAW